MENQNKYYTPDISEFYVGFEYEQYQGNNTWGVYIYKQDDFLYVGSYDGGEYEFEEIDSKEVRVKYLDKEDIESLGFYSCHVLNILDENNDSEFVPGFELGDIILYELEDKYIIYERIIYNETSGNWTENMLFQGNIKNKSELKKVLKMLNIN